MKHLGTKYKETQRLILRCTGINNVGICDMCWYGLLAEERK